MSWFVLHLRTRSEKKVAKVCKAHGLEYYLPLRTETKIYQRRKVTVHKPMFPGYLFVSFVPEERKTVLQTGHVIRIMEPTSEEVLVYQLDQIRTALEADETLGTASAITEGKHVRITAGPFMGIEGIVESSRKKNIVSLNIEMIGMAAIVEIDRDFVEILD